MERRLERSRSDRIVAGVSAGLGRYFDIDPTLVRVAFVLLGFVSGIGVVTYVLLALLMPREGDSAAAVGERARAGVDDLGEGATNLAERARSALQEARGRYGGVDGRLAGQVIVGSIFVLVGSILLLSNFVDLWLLGWRFVWPLLIIVVGLFIVFRAQR